MLDRRALIKLGLYGGSGALLHLTRLKSGAWAWAMDEDHARPRQVGSNPARQPGQRSAGS